MPDGQVVFEITGNKKPIEQVLKETTSSIEKETKNWDKAVEDSTRNMQSAFTKALDINRLKDYGIKAAKALADITMEVISAASDLREVQNVVDVTFGEGASQIDTWAKKAQSQFGLTETKAKQFTSTLGAMMKSSGLAGDEIIGMSTDLAGLAADMSSFYNLDFDTAFQKIRAGISGETEPLKQLGINMSVANLEAYALTQGITKAFDKMSQGEQTMLRYQYLMQATADAQGDFARTADSYANVQRRIQSSIESIKTSAGMMLMDVVEPLTAGFAEILEGLTATPEKTVLDEFADIDASTQAKMAEITQTANDARSLVGILNEIQTQNVSNASLTGFVEQLSEKISGLDQAINKAKEGDYAGTLQGIASAMELKTGVDAGKWSTLLSTISENLPDATSATDSDDQKTAKWLAAAGEAAATLGGEYPGLWQTFMQTLGSTDTENALAYMANGQAAADAMASLGLSAKSIDGSENSKWSTLLGTLATAEPTKGIFGKDAKTAAENVKTLADALSSNDPSEKQQAWSTMLSTLSANAEGVSKLTGTDVESTKKWLEGLAEAANKLDAGDTEGWAQLFTALKEGFTGLELDGTGAEMFAQLAQGFAQLGQESSNAEKALKGLGIDTSGVADKQALWLNVCKQLVDTIPGLSSIINTETGDIKGGIQAVNDYITAWEQGQKKLAMLNAISAKREALRAANAEFYSVQSDLEIKKLQQQYYNRELNRLYDTVMKNGGRGTEEQAKQRDQLQKDLANVNKEIDTLQKRHDELEPVVTAATEALDKEEEAVQAMYGDFEDLSKGADDAADATGKFADRQKEVEAAVKNAATALEEVNNYYEKTRDGIQKTLEGIGGAFGKIETPAQKAAREVKEIQQAIKDAEKESEKNSLKVKLEGAGEAIQTINKITNGLKSQISFYQEYSNMMARARELGYSDQVLAQVADGSAESYDYLSALTGATVSKNDAQVQEINRLFAESAAGAKNLSDELTDQALKTDEAFQSLVNSATEAVNGLNLGEQASSAMEQTVQGIAAGIAAGIPEVQAQIDRLNSVLSKLNNTGKFGFSFGTGLRFGGSGGLIAKPKGEFETGLDRVPFNDFLAVLHEGESVLTAEEAKIWRNFKYGGASTRNTLDYDALGATMRENVHAGGNVYLDGRTVGRVISARQADSFRSMERSGFQQ